jgi:MFS family permease
VTGAVAIKVRDWAVVVLLSTASVLSYLDRYAFAVLLEPIKKSMSLSDGQIGLLNGLAFGLFYACMGLPLGWLADRWTRKGTIMACIGIWSLATACCGLARNYVELLAARIGVGAGEAGLVPSAFAIIHDRFERAALAKPVSVFALGGHIGAGSSMLIAGFLYGFFNAGGGADLAFVGSLVAWQKTFVVIALPGIILVALVALIRENKPAAVFPVADGLDRTSFVQLIRSQSKTYILLFIGMAGVLSCIVGLLSWIPSVLIREFGFTPKQVGSSYGYIVLIAAPLGVFAGGFLADALQKRGYARAHLIVVLAGALAALPLICLLPVAHSATMLLSVLAILHFCTSLPQGASAAYILIITAEPIRSRVTALYVMVTNVIGLGVIPVLIGYLSDLNADSPSGLRWAIFYVLLSVGLIAVGTLVALIRDRGKALADHLVQDSPINEKSLGIPS